MHKSLTVNFSYYTISNLTIYNANVNSLTIHIDLHYIHSVKSNYEIISFFKIRTRNDLRGDLSGFNF